MKLNRLLLLILACASAQLSCAHIQSHQLTQANDVGTITRRGEVLEFVTSWSTPAEYQFSDSSFVVIYADGSKVEVIPKVSSKQFKQHPDSKYPFREGFHSRSTGIPWVYEIRKDKSTYGFQSTEYVTTYDATPKIDAVELGRSYILDRPEDGYERRVLYVTATFPLKEMDLDIEIPAIMTSSHTTGPLKLHAKYVDEWKFVGLAP